MSADLFAEFATSSGPSQEPQKQSTKGPKPSTQAPVSFSLFDDLTSATSPPVPAQPTYSKPTFQNFTPATTAQAITNNDDDDWGDFEGDSSIEPTATASTNFHAPAPSLSAPVSATPQSSLDAWNQTSTTSDPFAFNNGLGDLQQPKQDSWQRAPIVKAKTSADSNVLFDAENDFGDDDDFGDFEGTGEQEFPAESSKPSAPVPNPAPAANSSALVDLMGDLDVSQPQPSFASKKSEFNEKKTHKYTPSTKKAGAAGFGDVAKPKRAIAEPTPSQQEEDSWDTFDDWEASIPAAAPDPALKGPNQSKSANTTTATMSVAATRADTDDVQPGELPPTNVPPPGVLLSLFPSIFADAQEKLFKPMAAQTLPMRNKLLAEQATINYLQAFLVLANVAAHIIAGRKLRWKRDQHLSQGMRIGPASSRATSGMKLTGIDRGENLKEEREVADVVRAWKEQVGRLRHVVSGANQIKAGVLCQAPELQEAMPVRTLKQAEGGVPSRQPCMLCGLKRDERVTAADAAIEDSFGEWWTDQVNMHRGCRNFWNEHKDTLRQR